MLQNIDEILFIIIYDTILAVPTIMWVIEHFIKYFEANRDKNNIYTKFREMQKHDGNNSLLFWI